MTKGQLTVIENIINKEFENLRKSVNRPRSLQNILEKREIFEDSIKKYKILLKSLEGRIRLEDWNIECDLYEKLKIKKALALKILDETKIIESTKRKIKFKTLSKLTIICKRLSSSPEIREPIPILDIPKSPIQPIISNKMAKVDIKLGTALVQPYDGAPDKLNAFLDAVSLFKDSVDTEFEAATPAQKTAANATVLKFIKTRLTGTARQVINGAETLEEILQKLKTQCASKQNSDSVRAKLKALKQKGQISDFCDQVEQLTLQLASTYMEETIPANKANEMATKVGVETLISGVKNNDMKIILKAGTFTKINEATQKAQQYDTGDEKPSSSHVQIFAARGKHNMQNRGRGKYTGGRGNYYNKYPNFQNNQQQNRFSNYRGQGNRGRGRYGHYGNRQPQRQYGMYYAESDNQPVQQQEVQPAIVQQPQQINSQQRNDQRQHSTFLVPNFGQRMQ